MWIIQCRDLSEGNGALWYDLHNGRFDNRQDARSFLSKLRATSDEEDLCMYRIVEYGSDAYYSQPTDALEY